MKNASQISVAATCSAPPNSSSQQGATLIEVLVAILLMTVAMMGMAALQANAVSYQSSSSARSNAADLVIDITDRLRANLPNVPGYSVTAPNTFNFTQTWADQNSGTIAAPSVDCLYNECDAAERAEFDLQQWRTRARQTLPQGSVIISGDINAGMNISLMWLDKEYKTDTGFALQSSIPCAAGDTVAQQQVCCIPQAAAPAGVRCYNFRFLP